jgi:2-iminobutanoate/2-iminopropanoate deaminase
VADPKDRERFVPDGMYTPSSYDHATWAGDTLYVSGQVASDADGKIAAPGDAAGQAKQVWANVGRVLGAAGLGPEHVVKVMTYLTPAADREPVTAERLRFFGEHRPAHTGLVVTAMGSPEVVLEVEVVAYRPPS